MYGYEYELQRQRSQRLQSEAETQRMLNADKADKPARSDLRHAIGHQLVKLGTRLQGDAQPSHTLAAA